MGLKFAEVISTYSIGVCINLHGNCVCILKFQQSDQYSIDVYIMIMVIVYINAF